MGLFPVNSGNRRYSSDLIQGGLEVPCILKLEGDECLMLKTKKLLAFSEKATKINSTNSDQSKQIQTNPNKKIKLEEGIDVDSNSSKAVWVTFDKLTLNLSDKVTIEEGSWLSDMHIEFAQRLLRSQFTSIEGLNYTVYQNKFNLDSTKKVLQVLHISGNHWVVVSNLQCDSEQKMYVYDSLYTGISEETKTLIFNIFQSKQLQVCQFPEVQKQMGAMDCGVFAIATATSLLFKVPVVFTQSLARLHLINNFEQLSMQPFP